MESNGMLGLINKWTGSSGGVVTILKSDGKVLEFPRRLKCCELLAAYPAYTVCHAVAIVLKQQGKTSLAPDSYLEVGRTYFLLAKAGSVPGGKPQQFAISKKHIARIMQEAGAGRPARPGMKISECQMRKPPVRPGLKRSESPVRKPQKSLPVKRAMSRQRFVSSLSTIPEVTPV